MFARASEAEGIQALQRGDYATAFQAFRTEAEQGNTSAQIKLAILYEKGNGVPKDEVQAAFWYRKAAELGDAAGQFFLGLAYANGNGVSRDDQQAVFWYRKAAEQSYMGGQSNLGFMYRNGRGVPKDDQQSVFWYRKAAEQGSAVAQANLALMLSLGNGAPKDEQQAYFWALLGSAQGNGGAVKVRDFLEPKLSQPQRAAAQAAARDWTPKIEAVSTPQPASIPLSPAPSLRRARAAALISSGSGFAVTRNRAITNAHVVEGCASVSVSGLGQAKVLAKDVRSDLALLEISGLPATATLRAGRLRQGEAISVVGFPLSGLLASGAGVTSGNVSALAGLQNDTRFIQISAPVQPGNSGGPLVDGSGHVVGVVVSKLNAQKIAEVTGDLPQNINFAISPLILQGFLDANGVEYQSAPATRTLSPADVAEAAKRYTVLVECWK